MAGFTSHTMFLFNVSLKLLEVNVAVPVFVTVCALWAVVAPQPWYSPQCIAPGVRELTSFERVLVSGWKMCNSDVHPAVFSESWTRVSDQLLLQFCKEYTSYYRKLATETI